MVVVEDVVEVTWVVLEEVVEVTWVVVEEVVEGIFVVVGVVGAAGGLQGVAVKLKSGGGSGVEGR